MYWRVQKVSVEQLAKTYGVYLVCIASLCFNLVLIAKMPSANKLSSQQHTDFEAFAKEVTRHICDNGFMTYEASMNKLAFQNTKSELAPNVIRMLTPDLLPPTLDHMKAIEKTLRATKSVSQVSIDEVKVGEPDSSHGGWIPIDVNGKVVKSSAGEVSGPAVFRFRFMVGMRGGDEPLPVVADLQDLSGQAQQQLQ